MKTLIVDTNVLLRHLLKDNVSQFNEARTYFDKAKRYQIEIIVLPEVLLEVEFVLRRKYNVKKEDIVKGLLSLAKAQYFNVMERKLILDTIETYKNHNLHIVDCFVLQTAQIKGAEVLTFDKQLKKLSTSMSS
jgi:predicted nucleic-acid-binding protein